MSESTPPNDDQKIGFDPFDTRSGKSVYLLTMWFCLIGVFLTFPAMSGGQLMLILAATGAMSYFGFWLLPPVIAMLILLLLTGEQQIVSVLQRGPTTVIAAVFFLGYVFAAGRYVSIKGTVIPYFRRGLREQISTLVRHIGGNQNPQTRLGVEGRDDSTFSLVELITGFQRVLLAVAIATILLSLFPLNMGSGPVSGLIPTAHRTIRIGIVVVVGGLLAYHGVQMVVWSLLPPRAARVFLRSVSLLDHFSIFQRLAGLRAAERSRRASMKAKRNSA